MPQYDYQCQDCDYLFSEIHTIERREQPSKEPCPECSNKSVKKIMSSPMVCDSVIVGVTKPPSDFTNHILKPMKEKYKGNNIKLR